MLLLTLFMINNPLINQKHHLLFTLHQYFIKASISIIHKTSILNYWWITITLIDSQVFIILPTIAVTCIHNTLLWALWTTIMTIKISPLPKTMIKGINKFSGTHLKIHNYSHQYLMIQQNSSSLIIQITRITTNIVIMATMIMMIMTTITMKKIIVRMMIVILMMMMTIIMKVTQIKKASFTMIGSKINRWYIAKNFLTLMK